MYLFDLWDRYGGCHPKVTKAQYLQLYKLECTYLDRCLRSWSREVWWVSSGFAFALLFGLWVSLGVFYSFWPYVFPSSINHSSISAPIRPFSTTWPNSSCYLWFNVLFRLSCFFYYIQGFIKFGAQTFHLVHRPIYQKQDYLAPKM